jgi:hypothetical protein
LSFTAFPEIHSCCGKDSPSESILVEFGAGCEAPSFCAPATGRNRSIEKQKIEIDLSNIIFDSLNIMVALDSKPWHG